MAGQNRDFESGPRGGAVTLDVYFYRSPGGPLADDDGFVSVGTLPRVRIYSPEDVLLTDSTSVGAVLPVRVSQGVYEYAWTIPFDAAESNEYRITWTLTINSTASTFDERFGVTATAGQPTAQFTTITETRIGHYFQNPDLSSDYHYPGWGRIVTPDELRFIALGGGRLVNPSSGYTLDDPHLQGIIDKWLDITERDLEISILPRKMRYADEMGPTGPIDRADVLVEKEDMIRRLGPRGGEYRKFLIREPGYQFNVNEAQHYFYLRLRRRPLTELKAWRWVLPVGRQNILPDMLPYVRRYAPDSYDMEAQVNAFFGPSVLTAGVFAFPGQYLTNWMEYRDYPDAFLVDYDVGYRNAADVPDDIRQVVYLAASIQFLEDYSDFASPGIASASTSLNAISESYSTTQSATNSLYGARVQYYKDHLKLYLQRNESKLSRSYFMVL